MKISSRFLVLLVSTLVLSGCSSCPKKCVKETAAPVVAAKTVAAPVTPKVVAQPAPVVPVEPAEKKIPAAVLK